MTTGNTITLTRWTFVCLEYKKGVDVHVILTKAGAEIITPLALETMSNNPVITDMFNKIGRAHV